MTPNEIALIQQSFTKVEPIRDLAADLFYNRLFELDPAVRKLFPEDLSEQKKKLMATIAFVVATLDRLDDVVPAVQALGRSHAGYGVAEKDYDTVGAALLWTLEKGLGDGWKPDVAAAWTAAYGLLAGVMIDAQKQAVAV